MVEQKRKLARVSAAVRVSVDGEATPGPAVTRNLSSRGLFLVTDKRWQLGSTMTLCIEHRGNRVELEGRVIHLQSDGVGFGFCSPGPKTAKALQLIVDALLADGAWYDERRSSIRKRLSGPVVWRHGSLEMQSLLRDLSTGGAFIETDTPPPSGSRVMVYLPARPVDRHSEAVAEVCGSEATVAHASKEGFGIEFLHPSAEFRAAVDRLLKA